MVEKKPNDHERIACPGCGYCPADERSVLSFHDQPMTICEQIEAFDTLGAEEGHVFCPECSLEFSIKDFTGSPDK